MYTFDMLGAAGSGKSSLMRRDDFGNGVLTPIEGEHLAAFRVIKQTRSFKRSHRLLACISPFRRVMQQRVISAGERAAFAHFAEEHNAFFATVHEGFSLSERSQYRRAEGYYHFIRTVRRIAFLEEWLQNETVLFDESLSQKVYAVMPWDRGNEAHAREYFEHMPLPTALIHLDADAAQVVRQVRERERATGKLIPGHRGLSDQELMTTTDARLHLARIGAECLQARGCSVLALTASEPTEQNARRVTEFIQGVAP